jgi:hypothetical protein
MRYAKDTSKGPVPHHVLVPLLSLAPISILQPQEMTIEMDLNFLEHDNEVMIGFPRFPAGAASGDDSERMKSNAKLTMKINMADKPAGLSAVIEGYDKNLRAQIPS